MKLHSRIPLQAHAPCNSKDVSHTAGEQQYILVFIAGLLRLR